MKIDRAVFMLLVLHTGFLAAKTQEDPRLQFHQVPNSLSTAAIVEDWPRFNGVKDDACSAETNLDLSWSEDGPTLLWEVEKGDGYSSPAAPARELPSPRRRPHPHPLLLLWSDDEREMKQFQAGMGGAEPLK